MDLTLTRLRGVTQELSAIQQDLYQWTAKSPDKDKVHGLLDSALSITALTDFKAAVDDLRRFLWFYIDEVSKTVGVDANQAMHQHRLKRAAELLRVLSRESTTQELGDLVPGSFLEKVNMVVSKHIPPDGK